MWATGHHRNGILLAPLTAELVVGVLAEERPADELLRACAPARFAPAPPRARPAGAPAASVAVS